MSRRPRQVQHGSSGVLSTAGDSVVQAHPLEEVGRKGNWGWTLLRRRPGAGVPIAEYFKPGAIPTADLSVVYPLRTRKGDRYSAFSLSSGTVVKLYDFHVGASFMSFRALGKRSMRT
jgi:hypothetical protein